MAEDRAEMVVTESSREAQGPIAFPVTPFDDDLSLDVPGLRRNVQAILRKHSIAAIVAAGGTASLLPDTARTSRSGRDDDRRRGERPGAGDCGHRIRRGARRSARAAGGRRGRIRHPCLSAVFPAGR